ncbi:hypothetical protein GA0115255_108921, partial [Streptomyces sp. Ncost-T6T-2b]
SRVHLATTAASFILSDQPGFALMCALHWIIWSSRNVRIGASSMEREV